MTIGCLRKSPATAVPSAPYRRLLLPTDFGQGARAAAEAVRSLSFARSADVNFVHVYDPEALQMLGRALVSAEDRRQYLAECGVRARADLADFARSAGWEQAGQIARASGGSVAGDISRTAAEEGVDLIVLCRSNKGLVGQAVLGSVTEGVIRAGEFDVLVVPEHQSG